jgi:hypothetical protein
LAEVYEGADSEESEGGFGDYLHFGHKTAFHPISRNALIVLANFVMSRGMLLHQPDFLDCFWVVIELFLSGKGGF